MPYFPTRLWLRSAVFMLLSLGLPCLSPLAAQTPHLEAKLILQSNTLRLTDTLRMVASVRNLHPQRTIGLRGLPGFDAGGGFALHVIDPQGTHRTAPPTPDGISLPEAQRGRKILAIPPGYGTAVPRTLRASELFSQVGTYQVYITYRSPTPTPGNSSVRPNVDEGAETSSAPIELHIIQ